MEVRKDVLDAFEKVEGWISEGDREKLGLKHLKQLFGTTADGKESIARHHSAEAFYNYLSKNLLSIVMTNKKV